MFDLKTIGEILGKDIKGGEKEIAKYDAKISEAQELVREQQAIITEARQKIDAALQELRDLTQDKLQIEGVIMAYKQMSDAHNENQDSLQSDDIDK